MMTFSTADSPLLGFICCLIPLLITVIGVALYTLKVHYWGYLRRIGIVDKWQVQLREPELTIEPMTLFKPGALVGDYCGRRLRITAANYKVRLTLSLKRQTDMSLLLKAGRVLSSLTKQREAQVLQVGDERFDRQFLVKGQPEQEIIDVLASNDLRSRLIKLSWQGSVKIEIAKQKLLLEQPVHTFLSNDTEYLQKCVYLLNDLAEAVEKVAVNSQTCMKPT